MDLLRHALSRSPRALLLVLCLLAVPSLAFGQAAAGLLDGTVFIGAAGKLGTTAGDPEELVFQAGTIHSKQCEPYGFTPGAYRAAVSGETIVFEAGTISPEEGRIVWNGVVTGTDLTGTFVWHRSPKWYRVLFGNAPVDYWVKAARKP